MVCLVRSRYVHKTGNFQGLTGSGSFSRVLQESLHWVRTSMSRPPGHLQFWVCYSKMKLLTIHRHTQRCENFVSITAHGLDHVIYKLKKREGIKNVFPRQSHPFACLIMLLPLLLINILVWDRHSFQTLYTLDLTT